MSQVQQILTYIVVTLTDMMLHGDAVPEGTMIEVEKGLRDDWRGSRIARDATEEEIAEYRAEQGGVEDVISDDIKALATKRGDLEDEIYDLNQSKSALGQELETLGGQRDGLTGAVEALTVQREALQAEVAALEKAKAKAAK